MSNQIQLLLTQPSTVGSASFDFMTTDKREFLRLAWLGCDRIVAMQHVGGWHEFIADDGSVVGVWDDLSGCGYLDEAVSFCPIGDEATRQLAAALIVSEQSAA